MSVSATTYRIALSAMAGYIGLLTWVSTSSALPYPDESGVCSFFRGDTRELLEPCTISSGYGAGGHYAVLKWSNGVRTNITSSNYCPQANYDEAGFCAYSVDDYDAVPVAVDVLADSTSASHGGSPSCYRVLATGNSVCFSID